MNGEQNDVRQRLLDQFAQWVDRMLAGEPPPAGLPAELLEQVRSASSAGANGAPNGLAADLYTLSSAVTALTGEIRLQGRAFRQLADAIEPVKELPERLSSLEAAQGDLAQTLAETASSAENDEEEAAAASDGDLPSAGDVLNVLFDLRDRLERGLRTFDVAIAAAQTEAARKATPAAPVGWWRRTFGGGRGGESTGPVPSVAIAAAAESLRDGYRLTRSRLDAVFLQWGIVRAAAVGDPFDPVRMAAIEVQSAPGVSDGTVLEIYRSGYSLHGRVLVTAQVKVSKA